MKYEFWDDLIIEGTEDYIGLREIIYELKPKFPQASPAEIRLMTMEAVQEILESGLMQIGMFEFNDKNKLEYQIWDLDIDNIMKRIKIEWDELGKQPGIGDIAWLTITKEGEEEAKRILKSRKEANSYDNEIMEND